MRVWDIAPLLGCVARARAAFLHVATRVDDAALRQEDLDASLHGGGDFAPPPPAAASATPLADSFISHLSITVNRTRAPSGECAGVALRLGGAPRENVEARARRGVAGLFV